MEWRVKGSHLEIGNNIEAQYLTKPSLETYLNECPIFTWQRLWFRSIFSFDLTILVVFSSVTKPTKSIIALFFVINKTEYFADL